MKPRRIAAVAAVAMAAAAATLPAAQPAAAGDAAATVNGVDISVDEFESALTDLGADDVVPGDAGRSVLRQLVVNEAMRQFLSDNGVDPDETVDDDSPTPAFDQLRVQFEEQLAEADLAGTDELQAEYEASGTAAGLTCFRLFAVADGEAGEEAIAAISDGEEFDEVAADHDPRFEAGSGTLTGDPDQPCVPTDDLTDAAAPIIEAIDEAGAGDPIGPVETSIGVVVVLAPPYDEVSGILAGEVGRAAFTEFLAGADVTINPRYGRWDAATVSIVPLGQE